MQTPSGAPPARKSAFAAAFFSFLLPGLGQIYVGRWRRAAFWLVPWLLAIALIGGVAFSMGFKTFAEHFADTTWLQYLLVGIGIDLLWRLLSVLDAYWLARAPAGTHDAPVRRMGSAIGLIGIIAVLLLSHLTVAKPVYAFYDTYNCISGACDDSGPGEPGESIDPSMSIIPALPSVPPESLAPGASATPVPPPTPTPVPEADWSKGRLNILLVGTNGALTDTLIVVSVDPDTKQVAFIGIPRDTVGMAIPSGAAAKYYGGSFPARINQVAFYAGLPQYSGIWPGKNAREKKYDALKAVVGESLGIPINYYVQVDMDGFRDVIDTLGGAVVDVQIPVYDARYGSDDGRSTVKLYIPPGIHFMDGAEALAYARSRHTTSDFDRSARQMRTITAVRNQIDIPSLLGNMDQLLGIIKKDIRTDIPSKMLPTLAQIAQGVDLDKRISLQLTPGQFSTSCQTLPASNQLCQQNGIYALVANVPAMQKAARNVFDSDPKVLAQEADLESEGAVIEVLNGTTRPNLKTTNIADYLTALGMSATVPPVNGGKADRSDYPDTVLTAYNGAENDMPVTLKMLEKKLGVTAVTATDPDQDADFVVIVGGSTPALKP